MNRLLIISAIVAALVITGSYSAVKTYVDNRKETAQNISIAMYKENAYKSSVYTNTNVQVHVVIEKVSGTHREAIWEKNFNAKGLMKYPSLDQAIGQTINIPVSFSKKEHLEVSYVLTYDSEGSKLQMQSSAVIVHDSSSKKVLIGI